MKGGGECLLLFSPPTDVDGRLRRFFFLHHFLGKVGLAMEQKVPGNGRQKKEITTAAALSFFLLLQRGLY